MRLPIPWLLALVVVLGSTTVYIYIHVIAPPIVPAVAPSAITVTIRGAMVYHGCRETRLL